MSVGLGVWDGRGVFEGLGVLAGSLVLVGCGVLEAMLVAGGAVVAEGCGVAMIAGSLVGSTITRVAMMGARVVAVAATAIGMGADVGELEGCAIGCAG